jgi:hypothetical protein
MAITAFSADGRSADLERVEPFIGIYASVSVSPWMRVRSCFAAGSFTRPLPVWPALPARQAFTEVSEELPAAHAPRWASWARFLAALRSRSMTSPHPWQMNVRTASGKLPLTSPQAEHRLDDG